MGFHGGPDGGLEGAGEELGGLSEGRSAKEISGRHGRNGVRPEMEEMRLNTVGVGLWNEVVVRREMKGGILIKRTQRGMYIRDMIASRYI